VSDRSIGIPGSTDPGIVRRLAPRVESAGYRTLWINDTPGGDALAALAVAAEVTTTLRLATGVIPLDRQDAATIARRVGDLALPVDRLTLGVGSGGARRGLQLLEESVTRLRAALDVPLVIGALGPRTRALAARVADGVVFNWLDPASAVAAMSDLHRDAGGRDVRGVLYVRTIADPGARDALASEARRYAAVPSYAANFARLGLDPMATTWELSAAARPAFNAVDEVVLRTVTAGGTADELLALVDAGAPQA
jgi:alkanesulfonate monooxygenase SsuD/methylene tetrahydromethanopterin reductase-like flavin-dependent oxidoreductase (luciferase family)